MAYDASVDFVAGFDAFVTYVPGGNIFVMFSQINSLTQWFWKLNPSNLNIVQSSTYLGTSFLNPYSAYTIYNSVIYVAFLPAGSTSKVTIAGIDLNYLPSKYISFVADSP